MQRNFKAAHKDKFVNWECHHRMETKYPMHITANLLQKLGIYEKTQTRLKTKRLEMWMYDSYLASIN